MKTREMSHVFSFHFSLSKAYYFLFCLVSKPNVTLGNSEAVKFDQVIENIGGGYNPATGKFTAPVSGIYSISVSIMSEPTNEMHLGIMRNDVRLSVVYSNKGTYPQATNTLNFSMKKGDTAWVQRITGRVLHAPANMPYNVFTAVLIAMT
ncbi:hypothetical protein FSP39_001435 [Pinctada imbricata]|uniref:C1q domain-containing protein n=1 Tax=Pinctada imbricata TaxID=66713 RepID=A0AA88YHC5_PINIB|nr:hypothetical protein FSP39_001435 [Pinctada imbricata]